VVASPEPREALHLLYLKLSDAWVEFVATQRRWLGTTPALRCLHLTPAASVSYNGLALFPTRLLRHP